MMTGWNASEDRKLRPQLRKEGDSDGEEEEEEDWDILDEPGEEAAPEPAPAAASSASSASAKTKDVNNRLSRTFAKFDKEKLAKKFKQPASRHRAVNKDAAKQKRA